MIRSMTGYGRGQQLLHGRSITVEIRSVNHRYFEFSCRTPRGCAFLEDRLKRTLQQAISRGKVEVSLTLQTVESRGGAVVAHERAPRPTSGLGPAPRGSEGS